MNRDDLIRTIAHKVWQKRCDNHLEEYGDAERDWKTAVGIVEFFEEDNPDRGWLWQQRSEDYREFREDYNRYWESINAGSTSR